MTFVGTRCSMRFACRGSIVGQTVVFLRSASLRRPAWQTTKNDRLPHLFPLVAR